MQPLTKTFCRRILSLVSERSHTFEGVEMAGETRQKIMEAVERLVQLKGLIRVTTKDIARETGLSEGALYRHFNSKEEVLLASIMRNLPTFLSTFAQHEAGTSTVS